MTCSNRDEARGLSVRGGYSHRTPSPRTHTSFEGLCVADSAVWRPCGVTQASRRASGNASGDAGDAARRVRRSRVRAAIARASGDR
eukprot:6202258-Pleurochrysis_carterae.AAC.1